MNLIVAVDKNWGIGCGNELLARIPEDMKYFREKTLGNVVVMGRKTFESLPNGALPDRENIVLSRSGFKAKDVANLHINLQALASASNNDDIFIIGGESIYSQALPHCKRAYVTKIDAEFREADKFMINLDEHPDWTIESAEKMSTQSGIDIEFVEYKNIKF